MSVQTMGNRSQLMAHPFPADPARGTQIRPASHIANLSTQTTFFWHANRCGIHWQSNGSKLEEIRVCEA
jgi:hypothetical protein